MSTAFGITPQARTAPLAPIVKAIDRDRPFQPKRRYAPWSAAEDGVIRELASQGTAAIHRILPHRTKKAIVLRAAKIGSPVTWKHGSGYRMTTRLAKKSVRRGCSPLVRQLVGAIAAKQLRWDEIEDATGVAHGTIRRWTGESTPKLDTFVAALNAVGLDLTIIPRGQ